MPSCPSLAPAVELQEGSYFLVPLLSDILALLRCAALPAELDRIVLKDSCSQRPFANTATCRKAVITTRILQLVHE